MEEKKPRRLSSFQVALILIICVLGLFLLAESAYIVADSNLIPDLTPPLANKVAVIYVDGEMVVDNVPGGLGYASSGAIVRELREAQDDRGVKAIVLRINSPGGSPVAAQEIYGQILKTREVKPVVVSMGDMATSAAYYISAPCTRVVADPDSWTGSIGVIWIIQNSSARYDKEGVQFYIAKSGPYKDIGADWRGLTDEEKEYVNGMVNETFERFVDAVAESRHMPRDKVLSLADGRVYTGITAKQLGLIDEIGGMYDAIDIAARLGNISGRPEISYLNEPTLYSLLFGNEAGAPGNATMLRSAGGYYQPYYSPYGRIYA
jgi:protease-4